MNIPIETRIAHIKHELLRPLNEANGFFMRNGVTYSIINENDHAIVKYRNKKWKIKKDINFEKNKEQVLMTIDAMANEQKEKKEYNYENAQILMSMAEIILEENCIKYELYPTSSGFILNCKEFPLHLSFSTTASNGSLITVRTGKWTKTTSLITTALKHFQKGVAELCR